MVLNPEFAETARDERENHQKHIRYTARMVRYWPGKLSKPAASGRLDRSVTRIDGLPKIADPELADREWAANTRATRAWSSGGLTSRPR